MHFTPVRNISLALVIFLFLGSNAIVYSQNQKIDSLKNLLTVKEDAQKPSLYNEISDAYRNYNLDSSFTYSNKAIALSKTVQDYKALSKGHMNQGVVYFMRGDLDMALSATQEAAQIAKSHNKDKEFAAATILQAVLYQTKGSYFDAFKAYEEGLTITRSTGDALNEQICLLNIGQIFTAVKNYDLATNYLEQALALSKKNKTPLETSQTLLALADVHYSQEEYDKGVQKAQEAIKLCKESNNSYCQAIGHKLLANTHLRNNELDLSLEENQKAYALFNSLDSALININYIYGAFAEIYFKKGDLKTAEDYAYQALSYSEKRSSLKDRSANYRLLYSIHNGKNHLDSALHYSKKYLETKEQLLESDTESSFVKEQIDFSLKELELIKDQEARLSAEKNKQNITLLSLVLLTLFGGAILFILARKNQKIKQANTNLKISNKVKTNFLEKINHEFKTPLNAIVGFTDLLTTAKVSQTEEKQFLKNIKDSASSLSVMTGKLLDFNNYKGNTNVLISNPENFKELINSIVQIIMVQLPSDISLNLIYDSSINNILVVDKSQLQKALINLLEHTLRCKDKGIITLNVTLKNKTPTSNVIGFEIQDPRKNNVIKESSSIFEDKLLDTNRIRQNDTGTGVALSLSREIIHLFDGSLQLIKNAQGTDAFFFSISLDKVPQEERVLDKLKSEPRSKITFEKKHKILVVEDNKINLLLTKKILESNFENLEIIEALSGEEGVERFKKYKPNFVLMDIFMPGIDGYEAARQIRNQQEYKVPIVALSASLLEDNLEEFHDVKMDAFVNKPVQVDKLVSCINSYLV